MEFKIFLALFQLTFTSSLNSRQEDKLKCPKDQALQVPHIGRYSTECFPTDKCGSAGTWSIFPALGCITLKIAKLSIKKEALKICQLSSLKGSETGWLTTQMAIHCICRAFQVKFSEIAMISCRSSVLQSQCCRSSPGLRRSWHSGWQGGDSSLATTSLSSKKEEEHRGFPC